MKVEIDYNIFDSIKKEDDLIELNYLFNIILYKKRHSAYISDPRIFKLPSFQNIPQGTQDILKYSLLQDVMNTQDKDCLICAQGEVSLDEKKFSIEEGIRYLSQPVSIVVENSLNDSHFFKAIFRCLDDSKTLQMHFDNLWIQFENSGGCSNITNYIEGRSQFYQNKSKFFRCFVILDSDKLYPDDFSDKYAKVKLFLESQKITYHILEKRMMENYMPDDTIQKNIKESEKEWKNAYLHLSDSQKDYYNIPDGFIKGTPQKKKKLSKRERKKNTKNSQWDTLPAQIRELYSDLSPKNFENLKHGLKIGNIKSYLPNFFNDHKTVYKKSLLKRTEHQNNHNELYDIVNKIKEIL